MTLGRLPSLERSPLRPPKLKNCENLVVQVMCLSVAVANVEQPKNEIELNVQLAANFLASLLKKNWQNIKV